MTNHIGGMGKGSTNNYFVGESDDIGQNRMSEGKSNVEELGGVVEKRMKSWRNFGV